MAMGLNYAPEDVQSSEVLIASVAGSGVTFGILPHEEGVEPEAVAIAPKIAKLNDLRIGDTVEVSYVLNFPEHVERVKWRAVAVYRKTDGTPEKPVHGKKPGEVRRTIEQQVQEIVMRGEVWNRGELYVELFGESFTSLTASEVERARYEAVGHALQRLHDTSIIACAKVYGPGKKNATALYYAKNTHVLGRALMGLDVADEEEEE
jgi:hypothetical protein